MPPRSDDTYKEPVHQQQQQQMQQHPKTATILPPRSATDHTMDKVVNDANQQHHHHDHPQLSKRTTTAYPPHNTSSLQGWRRNTMHWEMNLVTFVLGGWLYRTIMTMARDSSSPIRTSDSNSSIMVLVAVVANVILLGILFDATRYYYYKGNTTGVPYTLPFVNLVAMVIFPVRYWAELGTIAMESGSNNNNSSSGGGGGMCTSMMAHTFMIFVTDPSLCRAIMTREADFGIYAHPNALWLFGAKNLIYMTTLDHKPFRALLTPALFSAEALRQYIQVQERICDLYLQRFVQLCSSSNSSSGQPNHKGQGIDVRVVFRTLAAASSQEAFVGPYLDEMDADAKSNGSSGDTSVRSQLEADILIFTMGFLSFPFPYWNSGLHRAIQAKDRIEHIIATIVPRARAYIRAGHAPRCMMDRWCWAIQQKAVELGLDDPELVPYCDNLNMARTVLDFLFAAQDATNSALTFCLDVLDEHRDVLQKVRDEVDQAVRVINNHDNNNSSNLQNSNPPTEQDDVRTTTFIPLFTKLLSTSTESDGGKEHDNSIASLLPYTAKVANQLLHHKPPVPMIPHIAHQNTTLGNRTIPKGTIVIPSITYSARVSGASVDFLPERDDADPLFVQTVVFGAGQHKCPGRRYAESLLTVFLSVLVRGYEFTRVNHPRPTVDEFVYYPTTFPNDCNFIITSRSDHVTPLSSS
jgi:sterol 22-desaturase